MPSIKLSDSNIRSASFLSTPVDYYDSSSDRPIVLRIGKTTKTFYAYVATKKGRLHRGMHKLGRFSENGNGLNLEQAKTECDNLIKSASIASEGFGDVTLAGYLHKQYKIDREDIENPVSEKTLKAIKLYFKDALGKRCSDLEDKDYSKFKEEFLHLSESSCRKAYYMFNAIFTTLIAKKRLYINPLEKRKFSNGLTRPINTHSTPREELYAAILHPDFGKRTKYSRGFSAATKLIATLVIDTGARPSEIRLNYTNNFRLDKDNPQIIIPSQITKTSKPRTIPIYSECIVDFLEEYLKHSFIPNSESRMFFNKSTNKVYGESAYRRVWQEIQKLFRLNGRFYDFRHTFATNAYRHTGDIKLVADLIGDTVATASKYYTNSSADTARDRLKGMK